jgi:hypothetical protein
MVAYEHAGRRADIARLVHVGAGCLFWAMAGARVLDLIGIKNKIVAGAYLSAAGARYCGRGNEAELVDGTLYGHYWIAAGDDVVDFSDQPFTWALETELAAAWRPHGKPITGAWYKRSDKLQWHVDQMVRRFTLGHGADLVQLVEKLKATWR